MQDNNGRIYFRKYGIIERTKLWLRSKLMEPQFFYVVIDTTDSTTVRGLPRGILNTCIVKALDENHARQTILRTMAPAIANQLAHAMYVYDLDSITYNIDIAYQNKRTLPLYSFMPLNGGRPPRTLSLPRRPTDQKPNDVTDISSTVESISDEYSRSEVPRNPQPTQKPTQQINENQQRVTKPQQQAPQKPNNPKDARAARSAGFRQNDYNPQGVLDDTLSVEQAQIVASLGAHPSRNGSDEGVNPRINSATGQRLDQSYTPPPGGPTNQLSREQLDILRSIGADTAGTVVNDDQDAYADEAAWVPEDDLSQIDGRVLSEEQLAEIQQEFKEVAEEVGVVIEDSKPEDIVPNVSYQLGESTIDQQIKTRMPEGDF